ncbi:MAG: hypothetical protein KGJ62_13150 [Armatimonadetes bacterium]|nr:hypothetical protein [Armatimonadota bacterium]MDE2206128.1 hypothetical protein [Armatimonadota bacterium]
MGTASARAARRLRYTREVTRSMIRAGRENVARGVSGASADDLVVAILRGHCRVVDELLNELGRDPDALAAGVESVSDTAGLPLETRMHSFNAVLYRAALVAAQCSAEYVGPEHVMLAAAAGDSAASVLLREYLPTSPDLEDAVRRIELSYPPSDPPARLRPYNGWQLAMGSLMRWLVGQNERRIRRQSRRS